MNNNTTEKDHRTRVEGSPKDAPPNACQNSNEIRNAYASSVRIVWKHRNAQSATVSQTVDMAYGYCDKYQPHAVRRIYE